MHGTSGVSTTSARVRGRGWAALLAALCCVALAACGGSGSSGFDAIAAENAAIDRALSDDGCEIEGGLTICAAQGIPTPPTAPPSASPTLSPAAPATPTRTPEALPSASATRTAPGLTRTPTPSPTPTATLVPAQPGVDIDVDAGDITSCAQVDPSQPCVLRLTFAPIDAPPDAVYRAAARTRDPDSAWAVLPVSGNDAVIPVPADASVMQVAVLLFLAPPGFVADEVMLLADSGADFAFVTAPLAVRVPPP